MKILNMKQRPTADFLHPRWAARFAILAMLWLVHWYLPGPKRRPIVDSRASRATSQRWR